MTAACARPLTDEALLAWWTGELPAGERGALERHLLGCPDCAVRAESLAALASGVSDLVRRGELPAVLLPGALERLRREGRRVREYRVAPGGSVQCTVGPDDDVVVARLDAELRGVTRLDLVARMDDGPERRLADVPFDPAGVELAFAPSADELRARPAHVERLRLVAVGPGGERLLGEYTFDHTPWPGRGATA